MKLTDYLEILAYDIAFWLTAFHNSDYPIGQLGEVSVQVTEKLRAAAIIALLANDDSDAFFHNLIRSARCRIAYLRRLRDEGIASDHHQASGRIGPFFDAVAAADFGSAREIVALSPREWLQGHEYEEDFCYAQIMHGLITVPTDVTRLDDLTERFARSLDGLTDARLAVSRAIAHRDQSEFESAFESLLAQRTTQIEKEKARKRTEEPGMMAERQVFIEGLALLQIATWLGFVAEDEYEYCPSTARVAMQKAFPSE